MENERNHNYKCRNCDGVGKKSTSIMNFHNIQTTDLSKEFETKMLDCIKCQACGHSWIPEKTNRELALGWWKSIDGTIEQRELGDKFCKNRIFDVTVVPLTGREIQQIYYNEIVEPRLQEDWQNSQVGHKPNQKQFKEFNADLATSYLNKFDDNGKKQFVLEAYNMLPLIDLLYLRSCITEIISEK
jgi:hypothetical protein